MSVAFYMDEHFHWGITQALRERGVDCLTAQEDGRRKTEDPLLLDRAMALGRVFLTYDRHFLENAHFRQRSGIPFAGLIYGRKRDLPAQMGRWINALEEVAGAGFPEDFSNQVVYLSNLL